MGAFYLAALALAAGAASAQVCQNLTVPVTISARNGVFNVSVTETNIDVTNFILNGVQQGHNASAEALEGYATISGSYDLAATYCAPASGAPSIVQLLTHGIGFDRSYWDIPFNNFNYSYTNIAVGQYGYATLSWDRLGIGMSTHPDPIADVQAPLEQAALTALTQSLLAGSISGVPEFAKVVHVGHSFGSELSYGLSRDNPTLTSGLVLSGFSQNGSFLPYFELGGNFIAVQNSPLASEYAPGYFAAGDASGVQTNFFAPNDFDPSILAFAFATGQPVSEGELLTIGGEAMGINTAAVPVLIITGERDLPYCGGDCLNTGNPSLPNIPSSSQQYFPDAKPFEVFIVPGTGHALNLEYTHPTSYSTINTFLDSNGLAASSSGSWKKKKPSSRVMR